MRVLPTCLALALAWLASVAPAAPAATDPLWESSVRALQAKDAAKAAEGFNQWIEQHGRAGIASPEAHYDLALAYWDLKQRGPAIYQVLKSASLRDSPLRLRKDLRTLTELQKEIGIKESVPEQLLFQLWLFLNHDLGVWLVAMGLWSLVGAALWRWARRPRPVSGSWSLVTFSSACLLAALFGWLNRHYFTQVGVLVGDTGINLYRLPQREPSSDPEEKIDLKLAELPSGTVVTIGKSQEGFVQITQPVGGWVPAINLKPIAPAGG